MISSPPLSRLHSLDAWPGETARPPLRLLEPRAGARNGTARPLPGRPGADARAEGGGALAAEPTGLWLRRLQAALGIA